MSIRRIIGIVVQEFYITRHSLEVIIDVYFWSVISAIVFGFITIFLSKQLNSRAAEYIFLGLLLWEIVRVTQYSISVGALWNVWSRNLSNMFIAPLTMTEYLLAHTISGTLKAMSTFCLVSVLANVFFHFNIFQIGVINIILDFVNLGLFAFSVGLIMLGLIFQYGSRIQAIAWSMMFLFQPLSAALFPLNVLPGPLQVLARFFPLTYVFESARTNLVTQNTQWNLVLMALWENGIYLLLAILLFNFMFSRSKATGQFVRNEG